MTKKLLAIIDDLSTVPGRLHDAYEKGDDGRFYLQVEAVDGFSLGQVEAAKTDADRLFEKLSARIRADVIDGAVRAAGGDLFLLRPHIAASVQVDRDTLAVRVLGKDGRFCSVKELVEELRERPDFAAAFDRTGPTERAPAAKPGNLTDELRAEKLRRDADAKKAAALQPKPILNPRSPGYSLSTAMAWARGNSERIAELQRAHAGR